MSFEKKKMGSERRGVYDCERKVSDFRKNKLDEESIYNRSMEKVGKPQLYSVKRVPL
jgi:hypothetical protein